jgi:hypothetical protein
MHHRAIRGADLRISGVPDEPSWHHPGVLTRETLINWIHLRYRWRHVEDRIAETEFSFLVSTQPDEYHDGNHNAMTYGNGPVVVIKRTGAVWPLSSSPDSFGALNATTEEAFYAALGNRAQQPPEVIQLGYTH